MYDKSKHQNLPCNLKYKHLQIIQKKTNFFVSRCKYYYWIPLKIVPKKPIYENTHTHTHTHINQIKWKDSTFFLFIFYCKKVPPLT